MRLIILYCLIFPFSLTESQLLKPAGRSLWSAVWNWFNPWLPTSQSFPFCVQNSSSSTTPSCSVPFHALAKGEAEPGSETHANNSVFPPWMNLTLARKGQDFANNYLIANIMSHGFGLIFTVTAPRRSSNILLSTHKSDNGERATYRYWATLTQVLNWYQGDLTDTLNSAVSTSLRKVKNLHRAVSQRSSSTLRAGQPLVPDSYYDNKTFNKRLWDAFYKDLESSDIPQEFRTFLPDYLTADGSVPLNQLEQALTQFAFVGLPVLYPERCAIGADATDEDFLAFNHLWAVLGYGLGIKDEYNIALQPNLTATRDYYQMFFNKYFLPMLFNSKDQNSTKVLAEAILEAFAEYTLQLGLTANTVMYRFVTKIVNIPAPNLYSLFSDAEIAVQALFEIQYLPLLTSSPAYRATMNTAFNTAIRLLGLKYFGLTYITIQSRAEEVYYA